MEETRIRKFVISVPDHATKVVVTMPKRASILGAASVEGRVCIYAEVAVDAETGNPKETIQRAIYAIGTNLRIPDRVIADGLFIGTVVVHPYVWHLYDVGEEA